MSERRYNEDEVALILRHAADARPDDRAASGAGITLTELKEIGVEVGIDPARIDRAARDLATARAHGGAGAPLGLRATAQFERVVPVRLEEAHLPRLLDVIRDGFARQGIVTEVLGGFEWRARGGMGGRYVSIRPEGDQTRIRVLGNYRDGMMAIGFGGGSMGSAISLAVVTKAALAGAVVVAPFAAVGGGLVGVMSYLLRRERHSLEAVLDGLEERLLELGEE